MSMKYSICGLLCFILSFSAFAQQQGQLEEQLGNFSHWIYAKSETIVNDKTHKVIYQKNNNDAGGPFLVAISPDSKYIVFDYGTGPGPRDFEVRDENGKIIFKDSYLNKLTWTNSGLEYGFPKSVPITKKCEDVGSAWEVQLYYFDGKEKKKINKKATIECSN